MSENTEKIALIITGLAEIYDKTLTDFTIKMYLEVLGGYDPELVGLAAQDCVKELGFMPRPVEITNRIDKHWQAAQRSRPPLPEPEPTDEDRAFGSFVCKAMSGWINSDFVKRQRDAGTFINYDHSLFVYIAEQKMNQKHIDRLAAAYPVDPRE